MGRVVNGSATGALEQPWAVQIRTKYGKVFCSGSLLTYQLVLTAAHCFTRVRPSDLVLVLGSVSTRRRQSPGHVVRRVSQLWSREDFQLATYNNDIAILKMDAKVFRMMHQTSPNF